jgi:hypothetical protein
MTCADRTEQDGLSLELSQLWMLPVLLLQMICSYFSGEKAALKRLRTKSLDLDKLHAHSRDLRRCEWDIRVILAEGARRLLAREPINLPAIPIPPMPEGWAASPPSSARAMSLRFEHVAAFHADPERFIRRNALRILAAIRRESSGALPLSVETGAVLSLSDPVAHLGAPASNFGIRAPP